MFRVVIPARWGSTRFHGKPLALLDGVPVIMHTWMVAVRSGAQEVVVATDDKRIAKVVKDAGGDVVMTGDHACGSERVREVCKKLGWDGIVVNLQGDEPRMPPDLIDQVARLGPLGTLVYPLAEGEMDNRDVAKAKVIGNVMVDVSRNPIEGAMKHIGIYAYAASVLEDVYGRPRQDREIQEDLEGRRPLDYGMVWVAGVANEAPGKPVDRPTDLCS